MDQPAPVAPVLQPVSYQPCLPRPHWRVPIAGFLWRTFDYFRLQGNVDVTPDSLNLIRGFAPEVHAPFDVATVVVCVIHTMASQPGLLAILERWYEREGQVQVTYPGLPANQVVQDLAPWQRNRPWSNTTWSLSVLLLNRFIQQPLGCREYAFLESLYDVYATLGSEVAMIELMVTTMFFVRSSSWVWAIHLPPHRLDDDVAPFLEDADDAPEPMSPRPRREIRRPERFRDDD